MNIDVYLVSGLIHYSPLYLAARLLGNTELPDPLSVRFIQTGNDDSSILAAAQAVESSIPLLLTSITDLTARQSVQTNEVSDFVLWFTLVQRPFFALCCKEKDHAEVSHALEKCTRQLRLACYPEGSTIRHLVGEFFRQKIDDGKIMIVDVAFPDDGLKAVASGDADLAVTIRPWDSAFGGKEVSEGVRLLSGIPTQPFGFTCGVTRKRYFDNDIARGALERLTSRVSEAVYFIYSSFDPFWRSRDRLAWSPTLLEFNSGYQLNPTALIAAVAELQFLRQIDGSEPQPTPPPAFPENEISAALEWMSGHQIWAFDSLEIPRLETTTRNDGSAPRVSLTTAKSLSLHERAGEAESLRIYREVKPVLEKLAENQGAIQVIANQLERVQLYFDENRWNPGRIELASMAKELEKCFDELHSPKDLRPAELMRVFRAIVNRIQEREFLNAFSAFREECRKFVDALSQDIVLELFNPLFGLVSHESVHPYQHAVETVYFAKALSTNMVPGHWIGLLTSRYSKREFPRDLQPWRMFVNVGGLRQVQFLRGLNGILSQVSLDDVRAELGRLHLEAFIRPGVEGMMGLEKLRDHITEIKDTSLVAWLGAHSKERAGKTLRAVGALADLPVELKAELKPSEGLSLALSFAFESRSPPDGEGWEVLLKGEDTR
jgi:hypothetical protein